ncbi:MAG TPA: cupin domain-containing protein [Candidatus Acidoferrales bacterium]|nr:cupin domain-containing protein [Candidatus Acidoferrales bacterium]
MDDFYAAWLRQSEEIEKAVAQAPRVARAKDLKWTRTRQDYRAALMIAPETGFPTGGSLLMKAEIPPGWHTGKHAHGEEAIYIERGEGFLVLDERRYDFRKGTIFHIPYRSTHQLFCTGSEPVIYISGLAWPLEAAIHMGRIEQHEDAGEHAPGVERRFAAEESQYWPVDGRRISMHEEQFVLSGESKHGATYFLMGRTGKDNGFKATAVAISSIFVDAPRSKSHSHAHPEAYLYALQGGGYSEIGGARHDWEQGDAVHVPPGMLHHQHFNPYDSEMKELRFEYGIRYWMVEQWRGYATVDRHMRATHMDD